jgi:hypothetical protein
MSLHAPLPGSGPTPKFRGKRRYFRGVAKRAAAFSIAPGPDSWWDLWHYHADWRGWGNLRWLYRRAHLRALATVFNAIYEAQSQFATPFQTWVLLADGGTGGDATYLHTPNRNSDNFPLVLAHVQWETLRDSELTSLFPAALALRVGRSSSSRDDVADGRGSWFIYSPEVGVPLEAVAQRGGAPDEACIDDPDLKVRRAAAGYDYSDEPSI